MLVCWEQKQEERVQHQRDGRRTAKRKSERWMRKHGSFRFFDLSSEREERINAVFDLC